MLTALISQNNIGIYNSSSIHTYMYQGCKLLWYGSNDSYQSPSASLVLLRHFLHLKNVFFSIIVFRFSEFALFLFKKGIFSNKVKIKVKIKVKVKWLRLFRISFLYILRQPQTFSQLRPRNIGDSGKNFTNFFRTGLFFCKQVR